MKSNQIFTYDNLTPGRKVYVIGMWLVSLALSAYLPFNAIVGDTSLSVGWAFISAISIMLFALWTHKAIVNRNLNHLKWIAVINFIPLLNYIGALITLSIIRTTMDEIEGAE